MGDVVDLKPPVEPTEIEAAAGRLLTLSLSPYLPENLKADLDTVVKAAIGWDIYLKKHGVTNA